MAEQDVWRDLQKTFEDLIKPLEKPATDFFETVADTFTGKAESLRDGTEHDPLSLPRDLYAHTSAQTEWWYYTGHFETDAGIKFGFELVFFKRRTDLDKFGVVPLRLFGNPIYFAHFALTDINRKKFRYAHRKSANGLFESPATASEKHYYVRLGDWSVREAGGAHVLRATLGDDTVFEATLKPQKAPILNGKGGVSFKDEGEASRYFSLTRISVEGDLTDKDKTEHFTGSAWMDREFGTWTATERQKGWDWFSIQLDNNCELMCYQLRDSLHRPSEFSSGTFVDENGEATTLTSADFKIEATGFWKSNTGATYPSGWQITVDRLGLDLTVAPVMENQELDTRGSTMIVYWEGACEVSGKAGGADVLGRAYAELVGYDRSHDNPNVAYFIFGGKLKSVFG